MLSEVELEPQAVIECSGVSATTIVGVAILADLAILTECFLVNLLKLAHYLEVKSLLSGATSFDEASESSLHADGQGDQEDVPVIFGQCNLNHLFIII